MTRLQLGFGGLVLAQAAHSCEEYVGRLWESFPPARFLTGLVAEDHERGFVVLNVALVGFGLWCLLWPVRRGGPATPGLLWFWVVLEIINGVGHSLWTLGQGSYTPGVATAPVLLLVAFYVARELRRLRADSSPAPSPTRPT